MKSRFYQEKDGVESSVSPRKRKIDVGAGGWVGGADFSTFFLGDSTTAAELFLRSQVLFIEHLLENTALHWVLRIPKGKRGQKLLLMRSNTHTNTLSRYKYIQLTTGILTLHSHDSLDTATYICIFHTVCKFCLQMLLPNFFFFFFLTSYHGIVTPDTQNYCLKGVFCFFPLISTPTYSLVCFP